MRKQTRTFLAMSMALGFLLGLRNGKLTLWREGQSHPEQVYDIHEDTLPPADRLRLRQGIRIGTREEVWMILENFMD